MHAAQALPFDAMHYDVAIVGLNAMLLRACLLILQMYQGTFCLQGVYWR